MKELAVNGVLKAAESGQLYRVLWISPERSKTYIFNMETLEMPYLTVYSDLQKQVTDGEFSIEETDPYLIIAMDYELSDKEIKVRDEIWEIMKTAVSEEPRIFTKNGRGELLAEITASSGKNLMTLHRYLKAYWQRGKTRGAFVPQFRKRGAAGKERRVGDSKRGRPRKYGDNTGVNVDGATKAVFDRAVKKYYHTRKGNTLKSAYDRMIKEHYTRFVIEPNGKAKAELISENVPTIGQFRYWYNKQYNIREKITTRKGEAKFNLNHRAIVGKSDYGIMGPSAKYEIDATIGDIYLVSRFNRADIIGRPVIYGVIDVFSRMVAGMYVGLEGPSWAGMMMAIANAASDKVKYCAEYGVEITEGEWPCRGVPIAIRGDRGELESKAADTLVNALNVRVENAPPFRADMKGIVEQHFNTINGIAMAFLPGYVKKDEQERGSKDYRLDAVLDVHQLTKILIQSVLYHNNHHLLENYERVEEMIADNIAPVPLDMWNWGISRYAGALRTFPEEAVRLALMPADTATVTPKGIRFKGMYYLCERAAAEHWFETARAKKSWRVDISYDPRNMSTIYVRGPNGSADMCWLSKWQEKYQGKCLHEIEYLHETEKLMKYGHTPKEMASKAELTAAIDDVIAEAEEMARQTSVPKSNAARTSNIRGNRAAEKARNRRNETFVLGGSEPEISAKPDIEEKEGGEISDTMKMIIEDLEERLNGRN